MKDLSPRRFWAMTAFTSVLIALTFALLFLIYKDGSFRNLNFDAVLTAVTWSDEQDQLIAAGLGVISFGLSMAALYTIRVYEAPKPYGDAKFAKVAELKSSNWFWRGRAGELTNARLIGKMQDPSSRSPFMAITEQNDDTFPNIFVAAPPGAGKTTGVIIPQLFTYAGSIMCLDVKGELFEATAHFRLSKRNFVYRFDPMNPSNSNFFNPLDGLANLERDKAYEELGRIADALMDDTPTIRAWRSGCIELFQAAGMLAIEQGKANIGAIYDIVAAESFEKRALETSYEPAQKSFLSLAQLDPRQRSSTTSILRDSGLGAWRSPSVRKSTESSDFSLDYLREIGATIYIITKEQDITLIAPLIRVMFQMAMFRMTNTQYTPAKHRHRVLFLLDEFEKLGGMPVVVDALKTLRGAGGRIVTVTQNLSQLMETYSPNAAKAIMALSGVQLFAATNDPELVRHISEMAGEYTYQSKSRNRDVGLKGGFLSGSVTHREESRKLITTDRITAMKPEEFLVIRNGQNPFFIRKIKFYADPFFAKAAGTEPQVDGRITDFMRDHHNVPKSVSAAKQELVPGQGAYQELEEQDKLNLLDELSSLMDASAPPSSVSIESIEPDPDDAPYLPPKMRK